jgi:hypothetical protein
MDDGPASGRSTFLGNRVPTWARARVVIVEPGRALPYRAADWADAVVVLERGEIVVEAHDGDHRWFEGGDVLCLADMPLVALHNHGDEDAVLVAVSRRRRPGSGGAGPGPTGPGPGPDPPRNGSGPTCAGGPPGPLRGPAP